MDLHPDLKKLLEQEDWDYFAHIARSFEFEIEECTNEDARLHRELQMIKNIVHAYLSTEKGKKRFLSAKYMVKLYKTINKLEKKLEKHKHLHGEFLNFLRALMQKMKQEKLIIYKTLEKNKEFQKHKDLKTGFEDIV